MLLLAIDTAGPDCAVAVARAEARGTAILASAAERIGRGHAERLMPVMEQVLLDTDAAFSDLDRIAVTTGPGSFTGVRVGIAAARGLALALAVPAVGVGSLEAIALPAMHAEIRSGTVVAVLDARRGEVYALARDRSSGKLLIAAEAFTPDSLASQLQTFEPPFLLCGAGAPLLAPLLGSDASVLTTAESPDIADVARRGLAEPAAGRPAPLYLRGADAKPQRLGALV